MAADAIEVSERGWSGAGASTSAVAAPQSISKVCLDLEFACTASARESSLWTFPSSYRGRQ